MALKNGLNMVDVFKDRMHHEVKIAVTDKLVKEELKRYESKLRPLVKETVDKIAFKGAKMLRDDLRMRSELHVFLKWENEEDEETTLQEKNS